MSFIGDLVGGFTGSAQKKDLAAAKAKADADLQAGADAGTAAYTNAMSRFDPYSETGGKADKMLADATGLNGQPAYQGVVDNFMGDPFRKANEDFAQEELLRHFNSTAGSRGGAALLAGSRASQERGSTDWNNWLDRLTGQKTSGIQVAGAQAGIDTGQGDQQFELGQQKASNEINYGNAMAANRNTLTNNLLGVAGTAIKAFTPAPSYGAPGVSPVANAMKYLRG